MGTSCSKYVQFDILLFLFNYFVAFPSDGSNERFVVQSDLWQDLSYESDVDVMFGYNSHVSNNYIYKLI